MPRAGIAVPRGEATQADGRSDVPRFSPDTEAAGSRPAADDSRRPDRDPGRPARGAGVPGRRTVTITGQGVEGYTTRNGTRPSTAARHSQLRRHERDGFRPDRVAMWAVLLGVLLILAAATSSHAAVIAVHHASAVAGLGSR